MKDITQNITHILLLVIIAILLGLTGAMLLVFVGGIIAVLVFLARFIKRAIANYEAKKAHVLQEEKITHGVSFFPVFLFIVSWAIIIYFLVSDSSR